PLQWVMHVLIFRSNVVVAQNGQSRIALKFVAQPGLQSGEPFEFILVFVTIERLPVRTIRTDHSYIAYGTSQGGRDNALLVVFVGWQVALYVGCGRAGNDGNPIVGFLTSPACVVANLGKGVQRKFF